MKSCLGMYKSLAIYKLGDVKTIITKLINAFLLPVYKFFCNLTLSILLIIISSFTDSKS